MSMENDVILGIDLGTTTVKAAIINSADDKILHSSSRSTEASVASEAGPLASEQDVLRIFSAIDKCISAIPVPLLKRVIRIGVCGQMHGLVMWRRSSANEMYDSLGINLETGLSILSNLYTWQDGRCSTEFLASLPKPCSHLRIATGFGCATLFWLSRHEPGSLDVYCCAGTIQDFLVTILCGLEKTIMTSHNAASWGYFDTCSNSWNEDILSAANFPVHLLPSILNVPGKSAGRTVCCWHSIPAGIPVTAAMGDLQCHMLAKLQADTHAVLNVGTSSQFTYILPESFDPSTANIDPASPVECVPYFGGRYLAETASLNGGNVLAAFVTTLDQWQSELGNPCSEASLWKKLVELADSAETVGSADENIPSLSIRPTLLGERHVPDRRGVSIANAIPANSSIGNIFRTLSRSIISNLRDMSPLRDALVGLEKIIGCGGALARNSSMQCAIAELYCLPLDMDCGSVDADAAFGAALAAKRYML